MNDVLCCGTVLLIFSGQNLFIGISLIHVFDNTCRYDHFKNTFQVSAPAEEEVPFAVNIAKRDFVDLDYYGPLNKGCPLNTGLTVIGFNTELPSQLGRIPKHVYLCDLLQQYIPPYNFLSS